MHEFDKCHFCANYSLEDDWCNDTYCERDVHSDYILDVNKILSKADELSISVTDVLNLIRECNTKPKECKPESKELTDDLYELLW